MKYKILIRYISTFKTEFYEFYKVSSPDNTLVDFETNNLQELKEKIIELSKAKGFDNIKVIVDLTYDITVDLEDVSNNMDIITSDEVKSIYNEVYNEVYTKDEE